MELEWRQHNAYKLHIYIVWLSPYKSVTVEISRLLHIFLRGA